MPSPHHCRHACRHSPPQRSTVLHFTPLWGCAPRPPPPTRPAPPPHSPPQYPTSPPCQPNRRVVPPPEQWGWPVRAVSESLFPDRWRAAANLSDSTDVDGGGGTDR